MKAALLSLAFALFTAAPASPARAADDAPATDCEVSAAEWSRPRSAAMVLALPGVRDCVRAWQARLDQRLVLVSAASEEGDLWASELRDWLVALGVPAAAIERRAVGTDRERLRIRVEAVLAP